MEWLFIPPLFGVLGATTAPDWQTIGSMIVGGLGLLGVLYTGARSRASSREANAVAWSKDLVARIETLERRDEEMNAKIDQLQDAQRETAWIITAFTYFTEQLFRWGRAGGGGAGAHDPHVSADPARPPHSRPPGAVTHG